MDMDSERKRYVMHKEKFTGIKDGVTMKLQHQCSVIRDETEILCTEHEGQLFVETKQGIIMVNFCPNCGYSID